VEGQILKAVDSAIEGRRRGRGAGVNSGNEHPPPPPPPLPPPRDCQRFCGKPSKAVLYKF
jgi:hypothetical protein